MSSHKKLKKNINNTFSLLYADCIFYKVYVVGADKVAADALIAKIASIHDDLLKRMNASEGKEVKGRVKAYYADLKKDFKQQINNIGKEIQQLP